MLKRKLARAKESNDCVGFFAERSDAVVAHCGSISHLSGETRRAELARKPWQLLESWVFQVNSRRSLPVLLHLLAGKR